jgi:putative membrane protein
MSKTQKEAFILIGTLIATFIVLLLANQLHVDSFWLNPILIFTILTVKSHNILQRILGLSTFIIFAIGLFFQLAYVGFLSAAINLTILSAIFYVYDDTHDTIISSLNDQSERVVPGRWNAIFFGLLMLIFNMIPYIMLDYMWDGTILELGGKTAIIYGLTLICEYISKNQEENAQKLIEYKRQKELASQENKLEENKPQTSAVIKFLAVWMIVLDLSIFSYIFNQNQSGFNLATTATLFTIVLISFIQSHDNKEDVLNIVYTWLRPFQATALLVLLISHEKTVNLTIFYIILILIVHALWMLNKITIKTTLVTSSIILFVPLIGYLSNPYRFINETRPTVSDVLFEKNPMPSSSFTLSDFWEEDKKLKMNEEEFYKHLNDD